MKGKYTYILHSIGDEEYSGKKQLKLINHFDKGEYVRASSKH